MFSQKIKEKLFCKNNKICLCVLLLEEIGNFLLLVVMFFRPITKCQQEASSREHRSKFNKNKWKFCIQL